MVPPTKMLALSLIGLLLVGASVAHVQQVPANPLAGAEERIYAYRTGPATVIVVDSSGKPVPEATVRVEQQQHEFLFGCNIFGWGRQDTPELEQEYRRRFAELFNFATLPFYWWSYEPRQGQTRAPYVRRVAQWCREHGIVPKGHPLAWNFGEPAWLPEAPDEVFKCQVQRVERVVKEFSGLIEVWDVVNEATHFDRPECRRRAPRLTNAWLHIGQVPFVKACFDAARRANPKATLLINDYRVDPAYVRLLEQLRTENGFVFDVIGLQSHQHSGTWSADRVWEVCELFGRFGVPLHFTETTILSGEPRPYSPRTDRPWPSTPEGERRQADEVERFYTLLFSHPKVEAITWWDLSDRRAWRRAPAGLLRADMSPKPAYIRLRSLIKSKWWTRTSLTTDTSGKAVFRGFFGRYRIEVRKGERVAQKVLYLRRGEKPPTIAIEL